MHLAIVHYHLNRGGVTRVIENQLRSLAALGEADRPRQVTIFHGGRTQGWNDQIHSQLPFLVSQVAVAPLDYDQLRNSAGVEQAGEAGTQACCAVRTALSKADCHPENTVLHIHNHNLGKNNLLLEMVGQLGQEGWRMLLQLHDFAEDLRPENYRHMLQHAGSLRDLQARLYPQAEQLHYAVLNHSDWQVLVRAGVDSARLHLLPNPALAVGGDVDRRSAREKLRTSLDIPEDRPFVIYPVRAIRRKNIGELLLWAIMLGSATFAVTLAPLNPTERATYEQWVHLASELALPVLFDVGGSGGMTLAENYAAADATITTSVAEGFGLVFLEASLADRPLFGRDLPGVTADFRQVGLQLPGLADRLQIPTSWVDQDRLTNTYVRLTHQLRDSFGLDPLSERQIRQEVSAIFSGPTVDFARLDRSTQQSVLRQVAGEADDQSRLMALNSGFRQLNDFLTGAETASWQSSLAVNRAVIRDHYSLPVIGAQYARICGRVLQSRTSDLSDDEKIGQSILQQFVTPSRLYPLRLSPGPNDFDDGPV